MWISVDIEANGPVPGLFSMLSLGAIIVQEDLTTAPTFYAEIKPISENYQQEALDVCKFSHEQTLTFADPKVVMTDFAVWIKAHGKSRPMMVADNPGDFMFITWYFWTYLGHSPFGHSAMNLSSLYKGMVKDTFQNFKHLKITPHTHNALDDCRGNAEALIHLVKEGGLKMSLT